MKSQDILLPSMIREYSSMFGIRADKDVEHVTSRIKAHGAHYTEVILPTLDDALLKGLAEGRLSPIAGFKLQAGTRLPRFLNGFWSRVFSTDGELLSSPDARAIMVIRQISRFQKKIKEVCADDRVEIALERFVSVDSELSESSDDFADIGDMCKLLFSKTIRNVLTSVRTPKHGPGSVANGEDSVQRFSFPAVPPRLTSLYGYEIFRATWSDLMSRPPVDLELPAKIIAVPKTATTPRLISIEPAPTQYMQQALHSALKREMGRLRAFQYLDQEPNKVLARRGSIDGSFATIDLSDASDRVSLGLVRSVFSRFPRFLEHLEACRSPAVMLPKGELVLLKKYASMGSSLTFPVQMMVFATIICSAIVKEGGETPDSLSIMLKEGDIRIYGDDIIVPVRFATIVMAALEATRLKVNRQKSFHTGNFRESCGGDYFSGINVTPVYQRKYLPSSRRDVDELRSCAALLHQLHSKGLYDTSLVLHDLLTRILGPLPFGDGSSNMIDSPFGDGKVRHSKNLHRKERYGPIVEDVRARAVADDHARLFKALAHNGRVDEYGVVITPDHHLTHCGRPVSASIKYRWAE